MDKEVPLISTSVDGVSTPKCGMKDKEVPLISTSVDGSLPGRNHGG